MKIVISGASGLIGSALRTSLRSAGHQPIALVRRDARPDSDEISWDPAAGSIDAARLVGVDGVVHLAGAGIGDRRWTSERKSLLVQSRVKSTKLLAESLAQLATPPEVFVCGSAIGIYPNADHDQSETDPAGTGFLPDLVAQWEQAAQPAIDAGVRTTFARTSLVFSETGGLLRKLVPFFNFALGGRIASGEQWMSWISLRDEVRALEFLLHNPVDGPFNLASPNPVTNLTFTKTLGAVLKRPTVVPVPMLVPRLLFGAELVEALLLSNQRIMPAALTAAGFSFEDPDLEPALRRMLTT